MMDAIIKIRDWLKAHHYDGVILSRRDNFAWVTGGKSNHVLQNTELGVASLVIKPDGIDLIADNIDAKRICDEETGLEVNKVAYPWYEPLGAFVKQYIGSSDIVSDTGIAATDDVQEQLIELRMKLSQDEVDDYKNLGNLCAELVEGVCRNATPGQTEMDIASQLKVLCIEKGISPDCVLVGSDERILNYRHPMPTNKKISQSLMVVLGAQRRGLNISITRIVYFGEIPEAIELKYRKVQYIFAVMQTMMKDDMTYKDYFDKVKALYKEADYEAEWELHHQGGPTGYGCREYVVTPACEKRIKTGQAYAWNPTITGTKCEETTLLTKDGVEVLTRTNGWPRRLIATEYGGISVADILVK
ncbi:M24 family metallopeptidase [Cellulosilyticum sp. I15G10I2]|uniref:M24 family metallopeptidase n=1 Tax=Cellulosilyticum sp. I15G10I2 TaxID=1892843 RepID=UPI001FA7D241|nr:M24 family metallopeptidase [Cellulosilyticum sp. I15G10I2]